MGLEHLGDAGIGIVAAVLIIREVMNFLAKREAAMSTGSSDDGECDEAIGKLNSMDGKLDDLNAATQSMAAILTRTDPDGLPLCYTPRSLGTSLEKLAASVDRLGERIR